MRRLVTGLAVLAAAACGGAGPLQPTPTGPPRPAISAPVVQAPIEDVTVENPRPELRVANATSDQPGDRTYDFQLADNAEFFGVPGSGVLLITKTGVAEGSDGKTSYPLDQDLPAPKRFFWRARAVQGATTGPWSAPARFKTAAAANVPPRIAALTASSPRAEADAEVSLTAIVEDAETPSEQLVFEWSSEKGSFNGTGSRVRWRAPRGERTPATYELVVTVIERYVSVDADGRSEPRENKVSARTRVRVHDSRKELTDLALIFLGDFANSSVSPETCVRNFSNTCSGRREELEDIRDNRSNFTITGSTFRVTTIRFDEPMLWAEVTAPCEFRSIRNSSRTAEIARGTCLLTAVYENGDWWLCQSHFAGTTSSGLRFLR